MGRDCGRERDEGMGLGKGMHGWDDGTGLWQGKRMRGWNWAKGCRQGE